MTRKTGRLATTFLTIFSLIFHSVAPAAVFAQEITASVPSEEVASVPTEPTSTVVEPTGAQEQSDTPAWPDSNEASEATSVESSPALEPFSPSSSPAPTDTTILLTSQEESITNPNSQETATVAPDIILGVSSSPQEDVSSDAFTDGAPVVPTPTPPWIIALDGTATTSAPVVLGQRYKAPQRDGVSVTFSRLPDKSGYLSIKEIQLSEEQRVSLGAISTTAYEITSTMDNGMFLYTLTLPYTDDNGDGVVGPENTPVDQIGTAVSSDGEEFSQLAQSTVQHEQKLVEVQDLDHFTVFVLVNDIDTDNPDSLGDSDDIANGVISAIDDTFADQNSASSTNGTNSEIKVQSESSSKNKRGFVEFDASSVSAGSTVTKATLRLFLKNAPSASRIYEAYRITDSWSEGDLTWNNQPGTAVDLTATTSTGTTNNVWLEWDVTADVQSFVDGTFTNNGWLIKDSSEDSATKREGKFKSSEDGTESKRPQLVVDFSEAVDEPTEYKSPTAEEATSGGDDGDGFETGASNAFADGGGVASNVNGAGDRHLFYNYNPFAIPEGSTINGIEVRVDWYLDSTGGTNSLDVELSYDGGTSWTSAKSDITETDAEHVASLGGSSDTWDRTWDASEFSDANFRVRVTSSSTDGNRDFFLDWIPVRVYYTPAPTTGTLIVEKQVVNDDGGNERDSDFTLHVQSGEIDVSGSPVAGSEDGVSFELEAGEYTASEEGKSGYSQRFSGDCDEKGVVTVVAGESKTCTITNNDIAPTITLVKEVINDHGGTASPEDFTLWVDDEELESGDTLTVSANTSYSIDENVIDGYSFVSITGEGCPDELGGTVTLAEGENLTCTITNDDQPGEIHGAKFEDENGNGEWDRGESGLSGWTIYLDLNKNGELDDDEPSAVTGENGAFQFTDLSAETYRVREVLQEGWKQTTSNPDPIFLDNGDVVERVEFGNFQLGRIEGMKFEDLDGNGEQDEGEPGLEGWTVFIDENDNSQLDDGEPSTTTDEDGAYSFENLSAETYRVREVLQDGWSQTLPENESYSIEVRSGTDSIGNDFGNFQLGIIRGVKFEDLNGNGVRDEGEPGLEDWTIYLDLNENGELDDDEPSTTTDGDGAYEFTDLSAGTYRVREVLQEGWTQTMPESGEYVEEVMSGSIFEERDFGNFQDATVTVYKWEDWDGDGEWDDGEPFIGDWPMTDSIVTTRTSSGTDGVPFQTEIVELQLSSVTALDSGQVNFKVSKPGTHRIEEGSKDNFQRTHPADSFFDVFVEFSGQNITEDKDGNPLRFGNIFFEELFDGKFAPTNGNIDSTPGATVLGDTTITVEVDGGASTISFPDNTVITRSDGESFDISNLASSSPALGSLTGLGSGVVVDGALQWGLVDLGLEFSQPVTVSIFVGTSFNGQTLNVLRSTSGSSGWTNDGIVAPATCTVVDGLCTFQTTKASFYAAAHTTSTGTTAGTNTAGGGGDGGDEGAPACDDTKPSKAPVLTGAVAGVNSVTLTWFPAGDPLTYYLVAYGTAPGSLQYGNPNIGGKGTGSFTVSNLSGGTTYYFRVRGGNGCMPGDYSNELAAAPSGGFAAGPAAGFAEGVLGVETTQEESEGSPITGVLGEKVIPTLVPLVQPTSQVKFGYKLPLVIALLGAVFVFVKFRKRL